MKEKAIEIIDLSFSYSDKADVLKGLNIAITEGESIGIIGPNGAGKTTFFHILCGLLKPAAGSVYIYGKESKLRKFNPNIGYVFQNPDDQLFNTTVYDDVAFGPMNLGLGALEVEKRVQDALGVTGCINFEKRPPHHLSGGEKRMAAIASVISMKPKIVIYDEPASNLDMRSRRKLIDFINSSEETKLIASHDLEFVLETCKRTVVLDHGNIKADGLSHEIMSDNDFMLKHGLEKPHSLLHGKSHWHDK